MAHPDPAAAALADVPPTAARVMQVELAPWGTAAVVLLEYVEPRHLAEVVCIDTGGGWESIGESEQPGQLVYAAGWRVCSLWPEEPLPDGVHSVCVALGEHRMEAAVSRGVFLLASWKRDEDEPKHMDPPEPRLIRA